MKTGNFLLWSGTLTCSSIPITDQLHLFPLPVPENIPPRPLTAGETESIETLSRLQFVSDTLSALAQTPICRRRGSRL
jgi:hypothetical protein